MPLISNITIIDASVRNRIRKSHEAQTKKGFTEEQGEACCKSGRVVPIGDWDEQTVVRNECLQRIMGESLHARRSKVCLLTLWILCKDDSKTSRCLKDVFRSMGKKRNRRLSATHPDASQCDSEASMDLKIVISAVCATQSLCDSPGLSVTNLMRTGLSTVPPLETTSRLGGFLKFGPPPLADWITLNACPLEFRYSLGHLELDSITMNTLTANGMDDLRHQ